MTTQAKNDVWYGGRRYNAPSLFGKLPTTPMVENGSPVTHEDLDVAFPSTGELVLGTVDAADRGIVRLRFIEGLLLPGSHADRELNLRYALAMGVLRLASASEGRTVLGAQDGFTHALGSFDRSFRMRTTAGVEDSTLREFFGEQALDFTAQEAAAWEEAIAAVAHGVRGMGSLLPPEVLVVKTTGREERDHAYTRANAIFLPASRVRSLRGERALRLLAHELFHVASRTSRALRDAMYGLLGFETIAGGPIAPPPELDDKRMTNPDAYALGHYLQLDQRAVVPLLICPLPLADVLERTSVLGLVRVTLLEIDPHLGSFVREAGGKPVLVEPQATDWSKRIARNSDYTIHPEEVLADNLSLLVRRRLGAEVPSADLAFLAAFEKALAGHA